MTALKTTYLGLAAGNKLLRKQLARAFPGVVFSVKGSSYAGGSSTRVGWIDGPLASQVEAIASHYATTGFDGSIDLAFNYRQWLMPSGEVRCAGTRGTAGSLGAVGDFYEERPVGAVPISTGIGYVFCSRQYSRGMYERALASVLRKWTGEELLDASGAIIAGWSGPTLAPGCDRIIENAGGERLSDLVIRELRRRTNYVTPAAVAA